ncbi:3-keto-steroid reductase erg27 [Exophiala dermatitidis]
MPPHHQYVLVTGANSGLGLGVCCRLIDEYLTRSCASSTSSTTSRTSTNDTSESSLTIIFTTRSARKGFETLSKLESHLAKHGSSNNRNTTAVKSAPDRRVYFRPENVELTSLLSVRALSRKLLASDIPHLDAIVLNAGIGAWAGLSWPVAIWTILTGIRQATTWPTYKLGLVGLVTKPQLPRATTSTKDEPVLGEVFCANVFGHYLLVHWLMPLLRACGPDSPGKVIWSSSIECGRRHYNPQDHQGLISETAYEHTKRLTDLLALTANGQPATAKAVKDFITPSPSPAACSPVPQPSRPEQSEPVFLLSHPGICTTTIISLNWIIQYFYQLGIFLARLCGSPWANVSSYLGAAAATWLALSLPADIEAKAHEATGHVDGGPCKWGSACDRLGRSSVRVTDVEGWGLDGTGRPFRDTWWAGHVGRKTGATDATPEDVEDFIAQAAHAWKEMELLRRDWETRIESFEATQNTKQQGNGHA